MSGELQDTVGEVYLSVANALQPIINQKLQSVPVDKADQWTFIAIILPPDKRDYYSETVRFAKKRRAFECRTAINYESFLDASSIEQVDLVAAALKRNVDEMRRMKVPVEDQEKIRGIVSQAAEQVKSSLAIKH